MAKKSSEDHLLHAFGTQVIANQAAVPEVMGHAKLGEHNGRDAFFYLQNCAGFAGGLRRG